jgi:hypothetical protein
MGMYQGGGEMIEIPIPALIIWGLLTLLMAFGYVVMCRLYGEMYKLHNEAWAGWRRALDGWTRSNKLLQDIGLAKKEDWPEEIDL